MYASPLVFPLLYCLRRTLCCSAGLAGKKFVDKVGGAEDAKRLSSVGVLVVVDLFFKGGRAQLGDGLLRLDEKFFDKAGERRDDGCSFGGWAEHGGSPNADVEVSEGQRNEGQSDSRQENPIDPGKAHGTE